MAEILLLEDEESVNRGIEFTLKKGVRGRKRRDNSGSMGIVSKAGTKAYDLRCEFAGRE